MTNPFPFQVLFCFEDEFKLIAEIKRTDIQSEDKSLVYKWLYIDKSSSQLLQLSFQSMNQLNGEQIREFTEGILAWNATSVKFNDEEMTRIDSELSTKWLQLIGEFLI
jgi:hypothetical protein